MIDIHARSKAYRAGTGPAPTKKECWESAWRIVAMAHLDLCRRRAEGEA